MAYCGVIFHLNKVDVHANCSRSGSTPFQRKLTFVAVFFFFVMSEQKRPFSSSLNLKRRKFVEINPFSVERTRTLALSDRGSHFNQEEWLKEFNETGPDEDDEERRTSYCRRVFQVVISHCCCSLTHSL